jgi:hypothetical protein
VNGCEPELVVGLQAIASFLRLPLAEVERRVDQGDIPTHKIGHAIAATPTGLRRWKARRR